MVLEKAGAFSVVLEFVTAETASVITNKLEIPTIGIGSGLGCDGQVLILHDILGVYDEAPSFAKPYVNLNKIIVDSLSNFRKEVKNLEFPSEDYIVHMEKIEAEKLIEKKEELN
jgi:3-methyl-2-oxobutanoate hydroxymethyltransferase